MTVVEAPGSLLSFRLSERATVLARIERRVRGRWRVLRDFDVFARRGLSRRRIPVRGLAPGRYRLRLTAYDDADNRSRTRYGALRIARR